MTTRQPTSYPLRLPNGLREAVAEYAAREGTSMNQFITIAVAEKLSAINTEEYFRERASRANLDEFWAFMNREDSELPREDDELPDGYVPLSERMPFPPTLDDRT